MPEKGAEEPRSGGDAGPPRRRALVLCPSLACGLAFSSQRCRALDDRLEAERRFSVVFPVGHLKVCFGTLRIELLKTLI